MCLFAVALSELLSGPGIRPAGSPPLGLDLVADWLGIFFIVGSGSGGWRFASRDVLGELASEGCGAEGQSSWAPLQPGVSPYA